MRKDLKDIIINTARRHSQYDKSTVRYVKHRYQQDDEGSVEYVGDHPRKVGMRANKLVVSFDRKDLSDRLEPLYRFLQKNAGRPWNDVYSEICQQLDPRSLRGWHARDHVLQYVETYGDVSGRSNWISQENRWGFWVDEYGILNYRSYAAVKKARNKKTSTEKLVKVDNKYYWFDRNTYVWYEVQMQTADWSSYPIKDATGWIVSPNSIVSRYGEWKVPGTKRQLNSKEIKRLRLN
jgi:hypothetical protein